MLQILQCCWALCVLHIAGGLVAGMGHHIHGAKKHWAYQRKSINCMPSMIMCPGIPPALFDGTLLSLSTKLLWCW